MNRQALNEVRRRPYIMRHDAAKIAILGIRVRFEDDPLGARRSSAKDLSVAEDGELPPGARGAIRERETLVVAEVMRVATCNDKASGRESLCDKPRGADMRPGQRTGLGSVCRSGDDPPLGGIIGLEVVEGDVGFIWNLAIDKGGLRSSGREAYGISRRLSEGLEPPAWQGY